MSKGNTRKVWQYIKELSGKSLTTKQINKITENGIELLDKKDIANSLNNYFATAADRVLKNITCNSDDNISNAVYAPSDEFRLFLHKHQVTPNGFGIPQITREHVQQCINSINVHKATGLDNISAHLLRNLCPSIVTTLCDIVNWSIETGVFPSSWKKAKVVPLHKNGPANERDNYRPISILSTASKILERHVHNHLYNYLVTNGLLCDSQSGFRKKPFL